MTFFFREFKCLVFNIAEVPELNKCSQPTEGLGKYRQRVSLKIKAAKHQNQNNHNRRTDVLSGEITKEFFNISHKSSVNHGIHIKPE